VALKTALRDYRSIVANGGWPTIPDGPTLARDSTGARIKALRERLALTGDLPGPLSRSNAAPREFNERVETAVISFQKRHGLPADGLVDSETLAALNVPAEERVHQLIVNLERYRWMPESLGSRHILVNIAAAELQVVEDGTEKISMRVVTGRSFRQTPFFSGDISYLVLNPFWHVPHSIATEDKLPKIKRNPSYLQQQNMKVFRGWGANETPVDPSTINWSRLSAENFPYRLRQDPGPYNALGRIKFMFPNRHSVYLHDTPRRGDLDQADRTFSSGCIRGEHPIDLAE
jgi:murein L,D-transpeptidase YcbB/YkuD